MKHFVQGERWQTIVRYFAPEFVTALLLYSMPLWLDAYFIAHLKSTAAYATLGATNSLLHLLLKAAEAVSVGTVIMAGRLNGQERYKDAGDILKDSFWITCFIGCIFACMLSIGAPWIYWWYGVHGDLTELGVPFLQLRALGVLFSFIFAAFSGFLRGIKHNQMVMNIFIIGALVFVVADYILIFGMGPIHSLGLQGSALAAILQYASMCILAYIVVCYKKEYRFYRVHIFSKLNIEYVKQIVILSWPVLIDKSVVALSYIWFCKMICPGGICAVATINTVKDLERVILLPAIAFAQVITFLVSNDWGSRNWLGILSNVKKIVGGTFAAVSGVIICLLLSCGHIARLFDRTGDFVHLVQQVFPIVGILVLFDVLQLILAGALRGSGNVKIVMVTRVLVTFGFFMPLSYAISQIVFENPVAHLRLIYASFYCSHALMAGVYLYWFISGKWKQVKI